MSASNICTNADSATGRRPGIVVDSSGCYPAAGLCAYAYAFLCSTSLSGDNRNLPAGRKPPRVNKALMSLFLDPREVAVWWATGLSQNHNHAIATGAESRSRLHKFLFHIYSNSVLLSTSPSSLIVAWKTLSASYMPWPFHSLSRPSLIKNL